MWRIRWVSSYGKTMTNESRFRRCKCGLCDKSVQFCTQLLKGLRQLRGHGRRSTRRGTGDIRDVVVKRGHQIGDASPIARENMAMSPCQASDHPCQSQTAQVIAHLACRMRLVRDAPQGMDALLQLNVVEAVQRGQEAAYARKQRPHLRLSKAQSGSPLTASRDRGSRGAGETLRRQQTVLAGSFRV